MRPPPPLRLCRAVLAAWVALLVLACVDGKEEAPPEFAAPVHCGDLWFKGRFILFKGGMAAGLDHVSAEMKNMISLAVELRRTLILKRPSLAQAHSHEFLGGWREARPEDPAWADTHDHWDGYYDLDKSMVKVWISIDLGGDKRQPLRRLTCPLQSLCKEAPAGWAASGTTNETCPLRKINQGCIARSAREAENMDRDGHCPLITLDFGNGKMMGSAGIPNEGGRRAERLNLIPAPALLRAADEGLRYLRGLAEERGGGRVFLLHVRRGDVITKQFTSRPSNAKDNSALACGGGRGVAEVTSPPNILHAASLVGAREDDVVYIMTNEIDAAHFEGLGEAAVFWRDVPAFKQVMEGAAGGDNYKLYALEKHMEWNAGDPLHTSRGPDGLWSGHGGGGNRWRSSGGGAHDHHKHTPHHGGGGGEPGRAARRVLQRGGAAGEAGANGTHAANSEFSYGPCGLHRWEAGAGPPDPSPPRGSVLFLELRKFSVCIGQKDKPDKSYDEKEEVLAAIGGACRPLGKPGGEEGGLMIFRHCGREVGQFCRYRVLEGDERPGAGGDA